MFVFIYTTTPTKTEAKKIAKHLLKKKLIACANIFPINSLYQWKGKIQDDKEVAMILKTTKKNSKIIKKEIEKIHSYKIPCITEINVKPNEKYAKWLAEQVN